MVGGTKVLLFSDICKFPEVCDVPRRSGLRFHQGTKPEHSRGCILVSAGNLNRIIQLLTVAQNENESVYIEIR